MKLIYVLTIGFLLNGCSLIKEHERKNTFKHQNKVP
jgi:hypothetical protein